ncbi:MAG: S8 family serine peptidase [Bacteroidales bacterium]
MLSKQLIRHFALIVIFLQASYTAPASSAGVYQEGIREWWVFFRDKDITAELPPDYLHPDALLRRARHGFPAVSFEDLPVHQEYLAQVALLADSLCVVSRWFNAVYTYADTEMIRQIAALDFVISVEPAAPPLALTASLQNLMAEPDGPKLLETQLRHLGGEHFHKAGIDGSGINIAIFDGGFRGVDSHRAFQHIVREGRIKASWDFHLDRPNVFDFHTHGTSVMSVVGGIINQGPLGLATGANFLLARTEIRREVLFEEKYWLAAAEWAERNGAHIINSSLGYSYHRYFPEQMDGNTTLISRAAQKAHQMGILVVSSAGNDGQNDFWNVIASPADSPWVLTVGALDPLTMLRAPFSSPGPTADNRIKPEVTAQGTVWAATARGMSTPSGTSFSSPLVAGFAACVMQMHPHWTNNQVRKAIISSASLYPYYDYAHGFGIPQASWFLADTLETENYAEPTFKIIESSDQIRIVINDDYLFDYGCGWFERYFYYHIQEANGRITNYFVLDTTEKELLTLHRRNFPAGQQLHFFYRGYHRVLEL